MNISLTKTIETKELINFLPHKGKMFLLSRVTNYKVSEHARILTAEYEVTSNCLFFDKTIDGIPAWVGFEFMAQSISALSGICGKLKNEPPKPGFILSVSNMELKLPLLKAGTTAIIGIREDCRVGMVYTFDGEVLLGDRIAASAKLTVMDVDDIAKWEREHGN
jgi:predicted hotdog family 3-hydroxylacyl-ACP dehydratase